MNAITVGTSPTLLAAAGNRDFINILNNDANPIFLCYDGWPVAGLAAGTSNGTVANFPEGGWIPGVRYDTWTVNAAVSTMQVGDIVKINGGQSGGFPPDIYITQINGFEVKTTPVYLIPGTAAITSTVAFQAKRGLTVDNGWPIPAGGQLYISNDGNRNIWNKEIWAISAAGGADVRIQGA